MIVSAIILPLFASLITGIFNKTISRNAACYLTSIAMIYSAVISLYIFVLCSKYDSIFYIKLFTWFNIGKFEADFAIYLDQLSSIMMLVVTLISAVVHIYSIGYMHDDENLPRFMCYLSLFTVCMMFLVVSDNFLQLFFGWEGVGLCSYLLIGFWYKKDTANFAATKAFVVNRVGDFAFILGIILIYLNFNSLKFLDVFNYVIEVLDQHFYNTEFKLVEVICFLLFFGAMGKSAQIGLHVWLADAMEGPTPVSALIHAATMVTAGVFLLARCSYLFEYAEHAREFVVIIGSVTCIFAALVAICQTDIKKIIAYSTCSQLGYMFIACGLSAYNNGIFHLFTHAFFKAMLFLGAGSVIHAFHEQDIDKMGGLKDKMPYTFYLFILGSLAIIGIFPLAGFYSKDSVLNTALMSETAVGDMAYKAGVLAAFCTALYSTKIILKVFYGEALSAKKVKLEAPNIMNIPLLVLALGTVAAGWFGNTILEITLPNIGYFKDSIFIKHYKTHEHISFLVEIIPMLIGIFGIIVGYLFFSGNLSNILASYLSYLYKLIRDKFYFDEIYNALFVKVNDSIAYYLKLFDSKVIDFLAAKVTSAFCYYTSSRIANAHSGSINSYAMVMVIGMVAVLSLLLFKFVL